MSATLARRRQSESVNNWKPDADDLADVDVITLTSYQRKPRISVPDRRWAVLKEQVSRESAVKLRLLVESKWDHALAQRLNEELTHQEDDGVTKDTYPRYFVAAFSGGVITTLFGIFYLLASTLFLHSRMNRIAWLILAVGCGIAALALLAGENNVERKHCK